MEGEDSDSRVVHMVRLRHNSLRITSGLYGVYCCYQNVNKMWARDANNVHVARRFTGQLLTSPFLQVTK